MSKAKPKKSRARKPRTVKTELDSVGMRVFVEYFDLFWDYALGKAGRQDVMAILLSDDVTSSEGGASWRAMCGRTIFVNGWVEDALNRIIDSRHIRRHAPDTWNGATACLKEYRKAKGT